MTADKTNVAKTGQYDKKQEKNVVCDEQLDYEVPKTDEGAENSGRRLCNNYNTLVAKAIPKKLEIQPFICECCTAEKIYSLNEHVVPHNELTPSVVRSM